MDEKLYCCVCIVTEPEDDDVPLTPATRCAMTCMHGLCVDCGIRLLHANLALLCPMCRAPAVPRKLHFNVEWHVPPYAHFPLFVVRMEALHAWPVIYWLLWASWNVATLGVRGSVGVTLWGHVFNWQYKSTLVWQLATGLALQALPLVAPEMSKFTDTVSQAIARSLWTHAFIAVLYGLSLAVARVISHQNATRTHLVSVEVMEQMKRQLAVA